MHVQQAIAASVLLLLQRSLLCFTFLLCYQLLVCHSD
jgi:hypothetical protein